MKKNPNKKKFFSRDNLIAELLDGFTEIIFELIIVGIGALVTAVLPQKVSDKINDWVIYLAGCLLIVGGITLIHFAGSRRKTKKNENKYGKIDPEHLVRRFDLLLGLGFIKETKLKKRRAAVTYTYGNKRFISFVLECGRVECFVGLTGEKPETLTASGLTDVSGDPTAFDEKYREANNMLRLVMLGDLLTEESELLRFLID